LNAWHNFQQIKHTLLDTPIVEDNLDVQQKVRVLMRLMLLTLGALIVGAIGYPFVGGSIQVMLLLWLLILLNGASVFVSRTRHHRFALPLFLAMMAIGYLGFSLLTERISTVYTLSVIATAIVFLASLFYTLRITAYISILALMMIGISVGRTAQVQHAGDILLVIIGSAVFYTIILYTSHIRHETMLLVEQQTEALIESESRFRTIFDQTFQLAAFMRSDGLIVDMNDNLLKLFGEYDERIIGKKLVGLNAWAHADCDINQISEAIDRAKNVQATTIEVTFNSNIKGQRIFEMWLQPVLDEQNTVYLITLTGREITALKQSERKLQREVKRYHALFKEMNDGLMLIDLDYNIIDINPAGAKMLGYQVDDVVGMPFHQLLENSDEMEALKADIQRLLENENSLPTEHHLSKKNKEKLFIEINPSLVHGANHEPIYIQTVFRDLTERRRSERQMHELELERERIKLLQDFVTGITHDLRTPLSNIKNSEYLLRRVGLDSQEKFDNYLNVIRDEVDKLTQLVENQIIAVRETTPNVSSIGMGGVININEMVRMIVATTKRKVNDEVVTLDLNLDDDLPTISGDGERIRMALRQIVINAIRFTKQNGHVTVSTQFSKHHIQVIIEDNGVGISEEDLPFIFDSLYRADRARHESASGLGLTIAHQIITGHGGTIEVESELGNGSKFTISLPIQLEMYTTISS